MQTTARHTGTILMALGLILLGLATTDATAGERKTMQWLDRGKGVRSLPSSGQLTRDDGRVVRSVRVQGVARRGGRQGLMVGRHAVSIAPHTVVESDAPHLRDAFDSPRVLAGRYVTIYGRPAHRGKSIEATFVIVRTEPHEMLDHGVRAKAADASWYLDPPGKAVRRIRSDSPK